MTEGSRLLASASVRSRPGSCGTAGHCARTLAPRRGGLPWLHAVLVAGWLIGQAGSSAAEEDPFGVRVIESKGRTVTAELVDLDGDGRQDLLQAVTFGLPPNERRVLRVYLQSGAGEIATTPSLVVPIPAQSAAYDLAQVDEHPGEDLLLLRPRGIGIVSFVRDEAGRLQSRVRDAKIPEDLTIGVSNDERGLDWLPIATHGLGPEPWLVVPGLGETFLLAADGRLRARIASGVRANFFLQPSGLMVSESDIQLFLDAPRISVGDIDGDGRADLLASSRHQLQLFFQAEDGSFPHAPSRVLDLDRISFQDHIRGSGAVRSAGRDIDRDGRMDLVVSETLGGVMNARYNTHVFFNRDGGWDLARPDYAFESPKVLGADQLLDVDGDGSLELMRIGIPLTVLELIEVFLQEAIDANLVVFGLPRPESVPSRPRSGDAWFEVKLGIPLDFETSRPAGFIPSVEYDFNGDGFLDYISSTDGTRLEIRVGDRAGGYGTRSARQNLATEGQIRPGDINGDGLTDLVLFNTRRDDQSVRLLTNRGVLPGTVVRPALQAQPGR